MSYMGQKYLLGLMLICAGLMCTACGSSKWKPNTMQSINAKIAEIDTQDGRMSVIGNVREDLIQQANAQCRESLQLFKKIDCGFDRADAAHLLAVHKVWQAGRDEAQTPVDKFDPYTVGTMRASEAIQFCAGSSLERGPRCRRIREIEKRLKVLVHLDTIKSEPNPVGPRPNESWDVLGTALFSIAETVDENWSNGQDAVDPDSGTLSEGFAQLACATNSEISRIKGLASTQDNQRQRSADQREAFDDYNGMAARASLAFANAGLDGLQARENAAVLDTDSDRRRALHLFCGQRSFSGF